jgi:hypothetical protein
VMNVSNNASPILLFKISSLISSSIGVPELKL